MRENATASILKASKEEFLLRGFNDASLRNIAENAEVTTGAIYAHYPDKEALFSALVATYAEKFRSFFTDTLEGFSQLSEGDQIDQMSTYSSDGLYEMLDYIYEHFDVFKLLLCCAQGTRYEEYVHDLVEKEVQATHEFTALLRKHRYPVKDVADNLAHILASAYFESIFECVRHNMTKEEAYGYIEALNEFFTSGWKTLLGMDDSAMPPLAQT